MNIPASIARDRALLPFSDPSELGLFGSMALLAMLEAGVDAGFRYLRRHPEFGARLAPHRALRHQLFAALIEAGVLTPAAEGRLRLDDTLADPGWDERCLDDANWMIRWSDVTRSSLARRLEQHLDNHPATERNRQILLDAWRTLGLGECLAFGEHSLIAHKMNPSIALAAAPVLATLFDQISIGQGCALMWSAGRRATQRICDCIHASKPHWRRVLDGSNQRLSSTCGPNVHERLGVQCVAASSSTPFRSLHRSPADQFGHLIER